MIIKLDERNGIKIATFASLSRFTLAVTEEVKNELKPVLSNPGTKLIFNLENIDFIDSSGIGCIISLVKTAKSNDSGIKICNLSREVASVFELLHLQMILGDWKRCRKLHGKFQRGKLTGFTKMRKAD